MTPLNFLIWLRGELRAAGIPFAITSGQACVYYGIQQTTKDSDWIVDLSGIDVLRQVLAGWDKRNPCQAEYRSICGAPLDPKYLRCGWTSHLAIVERTAEVEHHVDIFGKPPRVQRLEADPGDVEIASRHVVAQMKKTDRDKDWPVVFSLGRQMLERGDWRGVLHVQDTDMLADAWAEVPPENRSELTRQRPLLALIERSPQRLRRAIAVERALWVAVNQARYGSYQRAWKQFFRRWRSEPGMQWPLAAPFHQQHQVVAAACEDHQLPVNPFDERERRAALAQALADVAEIMAATAAELDEIAPPLEVLLP
jgi:hypothetical protein